MNFILKIWIWITFIWNKETLPTESRIDNPKMEFETMSGAFIWEDEGFGTVVIIIYKTHLNMFSITE